MQLRDEVEHQRKDLAYMRMLIENCAGCKESPSRNEINTKPNCHSQNPCYPGNLIICRR